MRSDTSSGTEITVGAKLRIEGTPAATSRSATSWAADAGVAMMPMAIRCSATMSGRSSIERTATPWTSVPITRGSASQSAATGKPRSPKPP